MVSPAATIVVENESVPKDRRVWNEAQTLRDTGWAVTVVCPRQSAGEARREVVAGIDVRRFSCFEARRSAAYPIEYLHAIARISMEVWRIQRSRPIDVLQICNPPDVLFPVAGATRRAGAAIVFDHHDLAPELWLSRGGRRGGAVHKALLAAERRTFRGADVVVSSNESYREVAIERGGVADEDCFVVRNGPAEDFVPAEPPSNEDRRNLVGYVGTMARQDGVDHLLAAVAHIVGEHGRRDVGAVIIGDGPELPNLRRMAERLHIREHVEFTGRVPHASVPERLAATSVCVCPDPPSPLNDRSTMIKVLEYLALAKPVVCYDLPETVVTAGDCAVYVPGDDPRQLARSLLELIDDPGRAAVLGRMGRARIEERFTWAHSEPAYLAAFERALSRATTQGAMT
jgi:glycosyltransferase involved in cell wall biosynthesis